jgi:hypothetical protein
MRPRPSGLSASTPTNPAPHPAAQQPHPTRSPPPSTRPLPLSSSPHLTRCRPLPSTAPSPDFNRGPTTRLESLQADSRAVALLVIKDTTNWLAQHKDACTAIKYTIASAATRFFTAQDATTLAAQDIIKLLMVKYVHRDRGFHAEMPLTLKTKLLSSYGALDAPSQTPDFKVTVPTTLVQYTLTVQDYKPQERNNQGGSGNSIIKGKICGHMGDPEIALGNERTLEDLVHTALAKVGLRAQAIRRATDELQSPLDFFYLDMEPSDGIENIYWARMHEIRNIRGPWGNNVTIKLNQEMCEKAYLCHKCLHFTNLCFCSKAKTKPNSTRTSGPATDPFAKYAKLN